MEITIQKINRSVITLEFLQDLDNDIDDITPLYNSLRKIKEIINKPGYTNKFTKKEKELWNSIFEDVLSDDNIVGIQHAGTNLISI